MCDFCKEIDDEFNYIVDEQINIDQVCGEKFPLFSVDCSIKRNNLYVTVYNKFSNDSFVFKEVPIKYCPFCGEKLKED